MKHGFIATVVYELAMLLKSMHNEFNEYILNEHH